MGEFLGTFESTAYGPPWDAMNGTGVTAGGTDVTDGPQMLIVAVDPDVIPLGTMLEIQPNPFGTSQPFLADDTGGAIQGNRIDFYDWRGRAAQYRWGRRSVKVYKAGAGETPATPDRRARDEVSNKLTGAPAGDEFAGAAAGAAISEEQRSGALKGLLWVVLVLGGAGLALTGASRMFGVRAPVPAPVKLATLGAARG